MGRRIDPVVVRGNIAGSCPRCQSPYWGQFDVGNLENSAKVEIEMACQSCNHTGRYFYQWPDELPKVTLRHVSNGRALGGHRKKKKKKNPDQVLKGQLAFDIPKDHGIIQ